MKIPMREFKAHLSHYLREAAAGEPVVITVHNKAVARLEAIVSAPGKASSLTGIRGVNWSGGKPAGCQVRLQGDGK